MSQFSTETQRKWRSLENRKFTLDNKEWVNGHPLVLGQSSRIAHLRYAYEMARNNLNSVVTDTEAKEVLARMEYYFDEISWLTK